MGRERTEGEEVGAVYTANSLIFYKGDPRDKAMAPLPFETKGVYYCGGYYWRILMRNDDRSDTVGNEKINTEKERERGGSPSP